jgi:hypothetical protein
MSMDPHGVTRTTSREVVGRFGDRDSFTAAVKALLAAGFERADLSVLDNHDSLTAAEGRNEAWRESLAGLVGEAKYLEPITTAGLILLASGPIGTAVAGVIAAGFGGLALYELLTEIRATPHTEEFARALEHGAVLLWVRVGNKVHERRARDILTRHGAADVHTFSRRPG